MANKIVLKKSSVSSKVPLATDLEYGELALNYTDEKLYFKNASNVIKSLNVTPSSLTISTGLSGTTYNGSSAVTIAIDSTVVTLTGTQTLTNKTLTSPAVNTPTISGGTINNAIIGGTTPAAITGSSVTSTGNLVSSYSAGDEGGEILLTKPQTNTTINGSGIRIDVYQNKLRFWEDGAPNRGFFLDLTTGASSVGSELSTSSSTQTLTNKTIAAGSNTITGLTNSNLSGSAGITNANLANSSLTIGSTSVSLGATATTLAGLTSVTSTTFVGALTGNATNVTGTVAIANGGTGATTRQNAMDALAGSVTSGQYLRGNGTDVVMSAIQAADVPTLNQNTTGSAATLTTGRTIALTGDVTYTSGSFNGSANVTGTATLANSGVTAGTYTKVTVDAKGRVTVGASIAAGDVPTLNQNTTGSAATLTTARAINGTSFNGSADITVPLNTTNRTTNETGHMVFTGTTATGNVSAYTNTAVRVNPSQGRVEANGISAASGLIEHANNITVTYTMKTGNNAISAGPVTIDTGGSITIPDGSTWIIVSPT